MKLVYTHPNHYAVSAARDLLEGAGIECQTRNEFAVGGIGELAPIDAWPELWVVDDVDYDRASRLIEASRRQAEGEDWYCGRCGEFNGAGFDVCWACGRERTPTGS